jgi:hypothetical protein
VPLDFGHDVARFIPAPRLIAKAGVIALYLAWRSPDRAFEQVSDLILQDLIARQADRVAGTLGFNELLHRPENTDAS